MIGPEHGSGPRQHRSHGVQGWQTGRTNARVRPGSAATGRRAAPNPIHRPEPGHATRCRRPGSPRIVGMPASCGAHGLIVPTTDRITTHLSGSCQRRAAFKMSRGQPDVPRGLDHGQGWVASSSSVGRSASASCWATTRADRRRSPGACRTLKPSPEHQIRELWPEGSGCLATAERPETSGFADQPRSVRRDGSPARHQPEYGQ